MGYEIIRINDQKTHLSAHQAAKVLIRFIPDSKKFPIFAIVAKGCTEKKYPLTRQSSFEYVNHILARMVQVDQARNDRFWAYIEKILNSGLNDADQNVRDAAYSALAKTELLRNNLSKQYVESFRKTQKDKYNSIKKYVLAHIQEEGFGSEGPGLLVALRDHGSNGSTKSHKKKINVSNTKITKSNKGATSPKLMDKNKLNPKITTDSRFTLTPQGFAELGAKYNANKQNKQNKSLKKSQSRKNTHSPDSRKKSRSPNHSKGRSYTVDESGSKKGQKGKKQHRIHQKVKEVQLPMIMYHKEREIEQIQI